MKVSEKNVQYVAELANLELTSDESARMMRDMNAILDHVEKLNELDTTGVEPMAQVFADKHEALREDATRPCLDREVVMSIAPKTDGVFFKVPKVIEK